MNQINIIKPYRWNGAWVFDDADVGLNREPLVAGAQQKTYLPVNG